MGKINDLQIDLDEKLDLSDSINLALKVSKLKTKIVMDLGTGRKNLNLRQKSIIKLEKNKTNNFDTIFFNKNNEKIDLFSENKEDLLKKKIALVKFKMKNFEFPKFSNKKDKILNIEDIKIEKQLEEDKKEEVFIEDFIEKNSKDNFQVYPLYKFRRKINYFKISFFIVLILFLGLLDKIIVETLIKTSYSNLILIKNDFGNFKKTKEIISSSQKRLFFAKILFSPFSIIPNQTIKNVNHIISGGDNLTKLLSKSIELYENVDLRVKEKGGPTNIYLTDLFEDIKGNYNEINKLLVNTYIEYSKITDLGDNSLNEKLNSVKQKLNFALITLDKVNKNYDTMLSILGEYQPKKYLVVFQNNDEIRATGGFIGSMAFVNIERGKVTNIEKKDVYALEWAINQVYKAKDKQKAPEGLNKITGTFGLRDANYFPEIKDSSAKIKYFLDKIDLKIDGIIFINQNLILDLIESIGGIYSKTFGTEITKENFSLVVSTLVEAEVFRQGTLGTPKQALFLFAEELFERLNTEKKYYDYLKIVLNHIKNRDLVFYSFSPVENSFLWKMGLNGEINFRETLDFNYPVYTSIGGNKSDRYIDYRYEKTTKKVKDSCDFETNLKIFNTHTYSSENERYVNQILDKYDKLGKKLEDIINIQGKGDNKSYLRVLLPKEADVKILEGQKVYDYENYKIVELYTETKAGQTKSYDVNYILKNNNCKKYSYKFFKQAGIKDYQILFNVLEKETGYNDIKTDFIYKD